MKPVAMLIRCLFCIEDPVYAPKAMFLSIQASLLIKKKTEATQTAKELKQKFPLYFAKIEVQDYLKAHGITTRLTRCAKLGL